MNADFTPPAVPQPRTSKLAVASLVLGILGLLLCVVSVVFAIPGLICGLMGMKRVKDSAGAQTGHGLALAGTIISTAALVMFPVVGLLSAIAIPNFVKARAAAQRNACIANLKSIQGAKDIWALEGKKKSNEVPGAADLFGPGKPLPTQPTCPAGGTYSFNAADEKPTCTVVGHVIY